MFFSFATLNMGYEVGGRLTSTIEGTSMTIMLPKVRGGTKT